MVMVMVHFVTHDNDFAGKKKKKVTKFIGREREKKKMDFIKMYKPQFEIEGRSAFGINNKNLMVSEV